MKTQNTPPRNETIVRCAIITFVAVLAVTAFVRTFIAAGEKTTRIEAIEFQRKNTQKLVDFTLDHKNEVTILADRDGYIFSVDGGIESIGWTAGGLLGMHIKDLRTDIKADEYTKNYQKRRDEGKTGEVHIFKSKPMISENKETLLVDGAVLWHEEKGIFVAYLARPR